LPKNGYICRANAPTKKCYNYNTMFKNLKSIFVTEDITSPDTQNATPPVADPLISPSDNPPAPPPFIATPQNQPDTQFTEVLLKALSDNNLQGLDYFEFKQSLKVTENMTAIDEPTRFRTAFAMGQPLGLTYQKLLETADYYIKVLERENNKFLDAMRQQGDGKNRTMIDEVAAMEKAVADKTALIAQLQQEIQTMQAQIMQSKETVAAHSQKIETTKNAFEASYKALRAQIDIDIQKIQQYLK
jgi:hypothetical protein